MGPGLLIHGQHIWVLFLQNVSSRPYTLHPVEIVTTCACNQQESSQRTSLTFCSPNTTKLWRCIIKWGDHFGNLIIYLNYKLSPCSEVKSYLIMLVVCLVSLILIPCMCVPFFMCFNLFIFSCNLLQIWKKQYNTQQNGYIMMLKESSNTFS